MRVFRRSSIVALLAGFALMAVPASAWDSIIYMPSWAGSVSAIQWPYVTHVNYAFVIPNGNGTLGPVDNPSKLQSLVSTAHANGKKVLVSLGGWNNGNDSGFEQLAANATARTTFTNAIINLVNQYGLDGIDIDWEYPDPGTSGNNATLMYQQVCGAMHSRGKLCTAAVVAQGGTGGGIQSGAIAVLDYIQIMAYDGGDGATHSPYSYAVSSLDYWMNTRGVPGSKIILGVPFYARPSWAGYNVLLGAGCSPSSDTCLYNGSTSYYNGQPTIAAKRDHARNRGARGIMAWEASQDVNDSRSLTRTMFGSGGVPTPTTPPRARPTPPRATPTAPPAGGAGTIVNRGNGKCLDAAGAATANGTRVQQWTCNSTNAQRWSRFDVGSGYVRFGNANNTNQVIDVSGPSTADGAKTHLWTYGGGANQQWQMVAEAGGYYRLVSRYSGKCLDVPSASTADGVQLQQWTCNGSAAQSFLIN
jgi:chitinase